MDEDCGYYDQSRPLELRRVVAFTLIVFDARIRAGFSPVFT